MKSKKALYLVAGIVFLGGLAFAFGNNSSFTGNLSGVIQQQSAKELLSDGKTAGQRLSSVMGSIKDSALLSGVSDKLDDDRYTGVTDMTREEAEDELEMLQGYIDSFEENQALMETEVNKETPDLDLVETALSDNMALFPRMNIQYAFLEDYRDYQSELSVSAAVFYEAFAEFAEENEAEYEALLEEQEDVQEELFALIDDKEILLRDLEYFDALQMNEDGSFESSFYIGMEFGLYPLEEMIQEIYYPFFNGSMRYMNAPDLYSHFRVDISEAYQDALDCVNNHYPHLSAPFNGDSRLTGISNCMDDTYLYGQFLNSPFPTNVEAWTALPDEIAELQEAALDANNFNQLDPILHEFLDLYSSSAAWLYDNYQVLFVDYINAAETEIASLESQIESKLRRLGNIYSELQTLQSQVEAASTEGQESLDALALTIEQAVDNFEWISDELIQIEVSAYVSINSLYQDRYDQLLADAAVDEDSIEYLGDEGEEGADEGEDAAYDYEATARQLLLEGYGLNEDEIAEDMKALIQEARDTEMEEQAYLEALSELAESYLGEDFPKEDEDVDEKPEAFDYESFARKIVEGYGVDYSEVEEKLERTLEEASDSQVDEDEFRKEVERITEEYIASTSVDAYLFSLDQIRYLEDQDVFMVNYSAVWLGAGISKSQEVVMNVEWNEQENVEFKFTVAISGSGQLYELKNMRDQLPYEKEALNSYVFSLSGSSMTYEIDNTPEVELSREEELFILLDENFEMEQYAAEYEDAIYEFVLSSVDEELTDDEFLEEASVFFESLEAGEVEKDELPEDPFSKDETVEAAVEDVVVDESTEVAELQEELEEALAAAEAAAQSAANAASAAQSAANSAASNSSSSQSQEVNVVIEYTQPEAVETAVEEAVVETVSTETSAAAQDPNSPFSDVSEGTWYGDAIVALHDEGIMQGNENGEAEPWKNGNRAELIVMIVRAFYSESELAQMNFEHQFDDVPSTAWYNMHVSAAVEFNILDEKSKFYPSRNMTRAEFITAFIRAANRACVRCDADFIDVSQKDWYYRSLATAVSADLISGFEDGTFRPDDEINRAQVAAILEKALEIGWVR